MKNTEWHDDEIHNHERISSNVWKSEGVFEEQLQLNIKHLILGRVHFTNEKSKSYTLKAYLGKTFVRYEHNKTNFYQELDKRNIEYKQFGTTFYIKGRR